MSMPTKARPRTRTSLIRRIRDWTAWELGRSIEVTPAIKLIIVERFLPTVFKAGALLINVVIIVYLIWRKRLFLERPSHERADETEPVPPDLLRDPSSEREVGG